MSTAAVAEFRTVKVWAFLPLSITTPLDAALQAGFVPERIVSNARVIWPISLDRVPFTLWTAVLPNRHLRSPYKGARFPCRRTPIAHVRMAVRPPQMLGHEGT